MKQHLHNTQNLPPDRKKLASPRTIDLFGRTPDGHPMLWKRALRVDPVTAFEYIGRWIASGHYVIHQNGDAIVVHCVNADDGKVSVQIMQAESAPYELPRRTLETMLLGKVAVSEEQQAAIFAGRRLSDFFIEAASRCKHHEDEDNCADRA